MLLVHLSSAFLCHQGVQGADQDCSLGQLRLLRPDKHPDFHSWTRRHALAEAFRFNYSLMRIPRISKGPSDS